MPENSLSLAGGRVLRILVVWVLALLLVSCNKQGPSHLVPKDWSSLSMSLSVGGCQLGGCPTYSFSVHGNGDLEYEGTRGVPTLGRHTGTVPRETVMALLTEFEKADFMSLDDRFQCDHGNLGVTLSMDGKTKTVISCDFTDFPEEPPKPSAAQLTALRQVDGLNWKAWVAYGQLPYRAFTTLGIGRWATCDHACMMALRLKAQHVYVGNDAVLAAIHGKLPQQVSSTGIDAFAFMEAGYGVNYSDRDGITPLMAATEKGDTKLVRNLLEYGARPMEKDKGGRTALDRVKTSEMRDIFRWYGNVLGPSGD
jgi:hypothetical protein